MEIERITMREADEIDRIYNQCKEIERIRKEIIEAYKGLDK